MKIFQGERVLTKHCNLIGEVKLTGGARSNSSSPQSSTVEVSVTFDLNANGDLQITVAQVKEPRVKQNGPRVKQKCDDEKGKWTRGEVLTISDECMRLSAEEIRMMVYDAEQHRGEDRLVKDEIERCLSARNETGNKAVEVCHFEATVVCCFPHSHSTFSL